MWITMKCNIIKIVYLHTARKRSVSMTIEQKNTVKLYPFELTDEYVNSHLLTRFRVFQYHFTIHEISLTFNWAQWNGKGDYYVNTHDRLDEIRFNAIKHRVIYENDVLYEYLYIKHTSLTQKTSLQLINDH